MLFPAQSIGVDQPTLHSSAQLSHHGTKSRHLEAKVAECCRINIKCGCPGFSVVGLPATRGGFVTSCFGRVQVCLQDYFQVFKVLADTHAVLMVIAPDLG